MKKKTKLTLGILGAIGLATSTIIPTTVLLSSCSNEDSTTYVRKTTANISQDVLIHSVNSINGYESDLEDTNHNKIPITKEITSLSNNILTIKIKDPNYKYALLQFPLTYQKGMFQNELGSDFVSYDKTINGNDPSTIKTMLNASPIIYTLNSYTNPDNRWRFHTNPYGSFFIGSYNSNNGILDGEELDITGTVRGNNNAVAIFNFKVRFEFEKQSTTPPTTQPQPPQQGQPRNK